MKMILFFFSLVLLAANLGANAEADSSTKTGELLFYGTPSEEACLLIAKRFEEATGIKTSFVRLSSGEALARIQAESGNMSASVWWGGPIDGFIAAKQEGVLLPYASMNNQQLTDEKFYDPEGYWAGIYSGYIGFVGNKTLLEEKGASMPQSWDDLLKPEYRDDIVMAHPGSSGTAYTVLATTIQRLGEEAGMAYMNQLNGQIRQYTKSGSAPARMTGMGETMLSLTFLHDAIRFNIEGYTDIVIASPVEGTGYEIGGVALLKGGPHQEEAKKFIDFALSVDGQNLMKEAGAYQFLTNRNATQPMQAEPIKGTKLIDYDFVWAGTNKKRLVTEFNRITGSTVPTK